MGKITVQSFRKLFLIIAFTNVGLVSAQEQYQIQSAIDSTSIEIGSVINYAIQVQDNKDKLVVFPDDKSFSPLEVIKSFKIDTLDEGGKYRLLKQYALTQFDTGHYTIPKQRVIIGDKTLFTDSLQVEVRDVILDSLKLAPIKGIMPVEDLSETDWSKIIYWIIGVLLVAGLVAFLLWKYGKQKEIPESELPAYDRAKLALNRVDGNTLLAENKFKEFYSQLTDAAKSYLDEGIAENALESTTDELIENIEQLAKSGRLGLKKDKIAQFASMLQTADFAKFAAINPSLEAAKADKAFITSFIDEVENTKPELSEEEKLQNEAYRKEQEVKRKREKNSVIALVASSIVLWGVVLLFTFKDVQFGMIKDIIYSRSTNGWLKKDWFVSSYGVPSISISSPDVLERRQVKISQEQQQLILGNQMYTFGGIPERFFAQLNTISFRQQIDVSTEQIFETMPQLLAQFSPENITKNEEDVIAASSEKGKKFYGQLEVTQPETKIKVKLNYSTLIFTEDGGAQVFLILYEMNDSAAKKVADRMLDSVKFNSGS